MNNQTFDPQNVDILVANIHLDTSKALIEKICVEVAAKTNLSAAGIYARLIQKEKEQTFTVNSGLAILDTKILQLEKPLSMMITLKNKLDLEATDNQPVDIIYILLSPRHDGILHLQRLSAATRMLKDDELRAALRAAKNEEELRAALTKDTLSAVAA